MDAAVLRQAPLFSQLDDEAAEALTASMTESRLRRGQVEVVDLAGLRLKDR